MHYEPPQTPHNVAGSCVALRQCVPVLQLLQSGLSRDKVSYVRRSVCRIKGKLRNRHASDVGQCYIMLAY